jgi:hypothetical protein
MAELLRTPLPPCAGSNTLNVPLPFPASSSSQATLRPRSRAPSSTSSRSSSARRRHPESDSDQDTKRMSGSGGFYHNTISGGNQVVGGSNVFNQGKRSRGDQHNVHREDSTTRQSRRGKPLVVLYHVHGFINLKLSLSLADPP